MNVLGYPLSRKRKIETDEVVTKRLKIGVDPNAYTFPEQKGVAGEVLVQQSDGTVEWDALASATGNSLSLVVLENPLTPLNLFTFSGKSNLSGNIFRRQVDPPTGEWALLTTEQVLPVPAWDPQPVFGSCYAWFPFSVPPIVDFDNNELSLILFGKVGGQPTPPDVDALAQDSGVVVLIWEAGVAFDPAFDNSMAILSAKGIRVITKLEPTGWHSTGSSNEDVWTERTTLPPISIDLRKWQGKNVNIGFGFESRENNLLTIQKQGCYLTKIEVVLTSRGDGVPNLPPSLISHTVLQDIGTNTHAQIDSHMADNGIHWDEKTKNLETGEQLRWNNDPNRGLTHDGTFLTTASPVKVQSQLVMADGSELSIGSTSAINVPKCINILLKSGGIVGSVGMLAKVDGSGYVVPMTGADPITKPVVGIFMDAPTVLGNDTRICVGGLFRCIVEDGATIIPGNTLVKSSVDLGRCKADVLGPVPGAFGVALTGGTGDAGGTVTVRGLFIRNDVA